MHPAPSEPSPVPAPPRDVNTTTILRAAALLTFALLPAASAQQDPKMPANPALGLLRTLDRRIELGRIAASRLTDPDVAAFAAASLAEDELWRGKLADVLGRAAKAAKDGGKATEAARNKLESASGDGKHSPERLYAKMFGALQSKLLTGVRAQAPSAAPEVQAVLNAWLPALEARQDAAKALTAGKKAAKPAS